MGLTAQMGKVWRSQQGVRSLALKHRIWAGLGWAGTASLGRPRFCHGHCNLSLPRILMGSVSFWRYGNCILVGFALHRYL